jgi:hypothetical protein
VLYDVTGKKSIHSWITNTKSGNNNFVASTTHMPRKMGFIIFMYHLLMLFEMPFAKVKNCLVPM